MINKLAFGNVNIYDLKSRVKMATQRGNGVVLTHDDINKKGEEAILVTKVGNEPIADFPGRVEQIYVYPIFSEEVKNKDGTLQQHSLEVNSEGDNGYFSIWGERPINSKYIITTDNPLRVVHKSDKFEK